MVKQQSPHVVVGLLRYLWHTLGLRPRTRSHTNDAVDGETLVITSEWTMTTTGKHTQKQKVQCFGFDCTRVAPRAMNNRLNSYTFCTRFTQQKRLPLLYYNLCCFFFLLHTAQRTLEQFSVGNDDFFLTLLTHFAHQQSTIINE